jgi:hypothetical protein
MSPFERRPPMPMELKRDHPHGSAVEIQVPDADPSETGVA